MLRLIRAIAGLADAIADLRTAYQRLHEAHTAHCGRAPTGPQPRATGSRGIQSARAGFGPGAAGVGRPAGLRRRRQRAGPTIGECRTRAACRFSTSSPAAAGPPATCRPSRRPCRAKRWDVCVIATPSAVRFIDVPSLADPTGHPVRSEYKQPDEPDVLPPPEAVVVDPATFNTINKWAAALVERVAKVGSGSDRPRTSGA